jgi:DNA ligase 4
MRLRSSHWKTFIGTVRDSPIDLNEHLMIMFYDILLSDDTVCIGEPDHRRRRLLESLVRRIPGRADIASHQIIDFSSPDAPQLLSEAFARAITRRWEGFVMKGCNEPYFSFNGTKSFIKLKKDHIAGLGDTADLVIVGGRRDVRAEQKLAIGKLWWTSFYIGCLENRDEVCRFDAKPRFRIIDVIDRHGISKENMRYLNRHGYFEREPFAKQIHEFDVDFEDGRQLQPAELFKRPFPVELMGAGFDKPTNSRYFALRFPRVLKIHEDRSFKDIVSLEELQEMARRCEEAPEDSEIEEMHWLGRLQGSDFPVERSRSNTPNDDSNSLSIAETTSVGTNFHADSIVSYSSKRKITSEILSQDDSGAKRARLE